MSDFLLVVEGFGVDGSDAAMRVSKSSYLAALFGHVFAPDDGLVLGYVWCGKHGWVRSDETCACDECWFESLEAQQLIDEAEADPVGRCRCGGLVVTQRNTSRVICIECGTDYPETPGWE